jgi:N-acylneuraminate cytidylyltransferase
VDNLVNNRIAVIPARGGSKRLPGKNIMDFMGKPMIAWTIEAALESKLFDIVLVSTDSHEIAEVSTYYGAQVPFLRNSHADDFSTVSEATLRALTQIESFSGECFNTVVQLMANCPLRSSQCILNQVREYEVKGDSSLLSGFKYGMFNPWWAHYRDENKNLKRLNNEINENLRSQDLPKLICPSGATWITNCNLLKKYKTFYAPNYNLFEMSWQEAIDIDDEEDYNLAKAAYLLRHEEDL